MTQNIGAIELKYYSQQHLYTMSTSYSIRRLTRHLLYQKNPYTYKLIYHSRIKLKNEHRFTKTSYNSLHVIGKDFIIIRVAKQQRRNNCDSSNSEKRELRRFVQNHNFDERNSNREPRALVGRTAVSVKRLTMMDDYA